MAKRIARWLTAVLAGQLGGAACHASGLTGWLLAACRWVLAILGF